MNFVVWAITTSMFLGVLFAFRKAIINPILSVFALLATAVWKTIWRIAPRIAHRMAEDIMKVLYENTGIWASIVNKYMEMTFPDAKFPKAEALVTPKLASEATIQAFAESVWKGIVEAIAPKKEITPEGAVDNATKFFEANLKFQLSAWLLHWISDTFSLGSMKSFKDLPNAISWSLGLGWLSWLVMGTPFRKAISEPLEVYYNRIYKSNLPTLAQAVEYLFSIGADDAKIKEELKNYGFNAENATRVISSMRPKMSVSDGEKAFKYGIWTEETYRSFLKHKGYHPVHADALVKLAKVEDIAPTAKKIVDTLAELHISGEVDRETLATFAKEIGMSDSEVDLLIQAKQLERIKEKTLTKSEILNAYARGIFSEERTREYLRRLGYFDEDIDVMLALQKKTLSVPQILDAYSRGIISREEAKSRIMSLGYSSDDADILLSLTVEPVSVGQIIDAFINGYLSIPQIKSILSNLGYSQEEIYVLIYSQITPTAINTQFKMYSLGIISREELEDRLRFFGLPEQEIQAIFTSQGKSLNLWQLRDMFMSQAIHRTDVYKKLLEIGYDEETAKALLDTYFKPYRIWKYDPTTGTYYESNEIWE